MSDDTPTVEKPAEGAPPRLSAAATKPISARRSECRSRKTLMPSFHRR